MQTCKYFYNGIPLTEYCKNNNLNINTIRARISKKRRNKKYENYKDQEIVDMVIETSGTNTKYMYKGVSLRQYCLEHGINIVTIHSRINRLKNNNQSLSNDELVTLAMEEFCNQNYSLFYKGIPLKEYCKANPGMNYDAIRTYIYTQRKLNSQLSTEELVSQYLNKETKNNCRYYYLGIPLKRYCRINNLGYSTIVKEINRYQTSSEFRNLSDNELVEMVVSEYQPSSLKYFYKGTTLRQYCIQNNISYYSVVSYIKRKQAKGSPKSIDELIDEGIKTINRYGIIYYYKGIPLKDYAKANNLNSASIRCAIIRKKLKSTKPLQEIIDECVQTYQKFSIKYFYNGMPLSEFCNNIGLNYNTVIHKYLDDYPENSNIDEAIKEIVDYYLEHPPIKTKYYFQSQSLGRFCNASGYSYNAIWRRIRRLKTEHNFLDSDEIIASAVKKYEDKLQIDKINTIFNRLKNEEIKDINDLRNICEFLKLDLENVVDLVNMDFTYNQAINIIWYFSDKKINDDYKVITDNKLKEVFAMIEKLKEGKIEELTLFDLIKIYKSRIYDARNEILIKQKRYIYKTIFSLCAGYQITVNENNREEFASEIKYYLLIAIERTNLNVCGQVIKYIDITVKGCFRRYLKEYLKQNGILSLDEVCQNTEGKTRMDYVSENINPYEELENTTFSLELYNILKTLPHDDLMFIILKFQENYSDEELANYFKITIDEVNTREVRILSLIKNNENIKLLKKSKKDS